MNTTILDMVAAGDDNAVLVVEALEEPTVATQRCPESAKAGKAPEAPKAGNRYPFPTKAEILGRLAASRQARHEALITLYTLQTIDEQIARDTKYRNRRGFMSSHAVWGTKLAEKLIGGEVLTDEEEGKLSAIVCRYGRQLAAHAREQAINANPDLSRQAAAFFKPQT